VEHCGIVGGEHHRNAMAEELRQGVLLKRKLTKGCCKTQGPTP
jgi:hypothetical protein